MKTIKTSGAIRNAALPVLFLSLITCIGIIRTAVEAAPLTGAIFTTDNTCSGVDLNIYTNKSDVFVDGGPAHPGAAGLPDGSYCVRVTDPSGATILGQSAEGAVTVVNCSFVTCYQLTAILKTGSSGFNDPGYDDTPNPGGEYKVWVSPDCTFDQSKTDNFKVPLPVEPTPTPTPACETTICVNKFYDTNGSGVQDPGEPNIAGWRYCVVGANNFSNTRLTLNPPRCMVVDPDTYNVYEDTPIEANWVHSTPISAQFALAACDSHTVSFGNFCVGPGGGLTLGFWSNKNGQAMITKGQLCSLNALCLVNATGGAFDPIVGCPAPSNPQFSAGKTALKNWLLSANAVNMAYMLSAQLATMELNVLNSKVDGSALIYEPCLKDYGYPTGVISINDLMTLANNLLCADGYTPSGDPNRAEQECVKNALDHANNNLNFIQAPGTCPFTFGEETCPFTNP